MIREYPERPIIGVGAIVLRDADVLLIRRAKPPREGQWSIPGGAVELGETLRDALVREVKEEAGIEIDIIGFVDTIDAITRDEDGRIRYHYTLIDMAARWRSGELAPGGDATAARWVPLDRLGEYDLWDETIRVIGLANELVNKQS